MHQHQREAVRVADAAATQRTAQRDQQRDRRDSGPDQSCPQRQPLQDGWQPPARERASGRGEGHMDRVDVVGGAAHARRGPTQINYRNDLCHQPHGQRRENRDGTTVRRGSPAAASERHHS